MLMPLPFFILLLAISKSYSQKISHIIKYNTR